MDFVVDKEYQINEVFKHEQTGKTLMCVQASPLCGGCVGDDYADCGSNFCCPRDRKNGISVIYKEVTGPVEGMLYRACGRLFKLLNRSHWGLTCACCTKSGLMCSTLDLRVFGEMTTTDWCWELVEEKEAGAPKAEPKPFKVEPKPAMRRLVLSDATVRSGDSVTFRIKEQTHRDDEFTPKGYSFSATSGVLLESAAGPEVQEGWNKLYVRGCNNSYDNNKLTCSPELYLKIKEAIREYNETDGMGYSKLVAKKEEPMKKEEAVVKCQIKLGPPHQEDDVVYFCILEQSRRGAEFSSRGNIFVASTGYRLQSASCPCNSRGALCWVRGDSICSDYDIIRMPKAEYDKLVVAVEEYNATNGCGYPGKAEEFPKENETFYWVPGDGEVMSTEYSSSFSGDCIRKNIGNCFKTKEDASYAKDEIAATLKRVHEKLGY